MRASTAQLRVECWHRSTVDVDLWLKSSKPTERYIYAHSYALLDPLLAQHMEKLRVAGEITLTRARADDGAFDYLAIRNRVRVSLPPRPRPQAGTVLDPAMSALFLKLKYCARLSERCPSDRALGNALGITADQVKWAMRKLVAAGLVHTRLVPTSAEPKFRVVTIVSTGLETALPKAGRS